MSAVLTPAVQRLLDAAKFAIEVIDCCNEGISIGDEAAEDLRAAIQAVEAEQA